MGGTPGVTQQLPRRAVEGWRASFVQPHNLASSQLCLKTRIWHLEACPPSDLNLISLIHIYSLRETVQLDPTYRQ